MTIPTGVWAATVRDLDQVEHEITVEVIEASDDQVAFKVPETAVIDMREVENHPGLYRESSSNYILDIKGSFWWATKVRYTSRVPMILHMRYLQITGKHLAVSNVCSVVEFRALLLEPK